MDGMCPKPMTPGDDKATPPVMLGCSAIEQSSSSMCLHDLSQQAHFMVDVAGIASTISI